MNREGWGRSPQRAAVRTTGWRRERQPYLRCSRSWSVRKWGLHEPGVIFDFSLAIVDCPTVDKAEPMPDNEIDGHAGFLCGM